MWKITIEINQLEKIQDIQFRVTFATQKINRFNTDISNIKIKDWPISEQIQCFWQGKVLSLVIAYCSKFWSYMLSSTYESIQGSFVPNYNSSSNYKFLSKVL